MKSQGEKIDKKDNEKIKVFVGVSGGVVNATAGTSGDDRVEIRGAVLAGEFSRTKNPSSRTRTQRRVPSDRAATTNRPRAIHLHRGLGPS
jgi:hypothetical protein